MEKFKKNNPAKYQSITLRRKLDADVIRVGAEMKEMVDKYGFDFLPLLLVCSDTASDILKLQYLPKDEHQLEQLFSRMGEVVAEKVDDVYGFMLVMHYRGAGVKLLRIAVKSIEGQSKNIFLNFAIKDGKVEWFGKEEKTAWLSKAADKDFFSKPSVYNLETLWLSYRCNLLFKK